MKKGELLYEGKAKKVFKTDDPALLIQQFKDDAAAGQARLAPTETSGQAAGQAGKCDGS